MGNGWRFLWGSYSQTRRAASGQMRSVDRPAQIVDELFEPERITLGINEDIWDIRGCGIVRCGVLPFPAPSPAAVAKAFELRDDDACYREIDESEARWLHVTTRIGSARRSDDGSASVTFPEEKPIEKARTCGNAVQLRHFEVPNGVTLRQLFDCFCGRTSCCGSHA